MRPSSHFAFPLAIVVTAAVALLPAEWRVGPKLDWENDLAAIARFPLRPFTHFGVTMASWLRPGPTPIDRTPAGSRDLITQIEERELAERLYYAEHQRVIELERQLHELQQIPSHVRRAAKATVFAYVTRRNPSSSLGVVELAIESGVAETIYPNTPAVYASADLIGRTVGEPSNSICSLLPLTNPATRLIRARIFPEVQSAFPTSQDVNVHLEPTGTGTFIGDVERDAVIDLGDLVRLDDPSWPDTAQMMVIGQIESIKVKDEEPLRNRIVVRPRYQVQEISHVALIIDRQASALGQADNGEDGS